MKSARAGYRSVAHRVEKRFFRTATVDGYGPIIFRPLSKRDMEEIARDQLGSLDLGVALVIQRAIVAPRHEQMADLPDEVRDAIGTAIIEGSWPN